MHLLHQREDGSGGRIMFENRYNDLTIEDLKILLHEVKLELMIMEEEE